jgi:hypothetical protein
MATEFGYLLNAMERAACESNPAKHNYHDKRIAVLGHVSAIEAERDRLRAELAESKKEIALLKTPNLVWDFDDPENSAVDSVADAVYQHIDWWGDINVGDVMTFLTARKLSNVTIRITSVNDDGEVTFEAIDAAMAGGE